MEPFTKVKLILLVVAVVAACGGAAYWFYKKRADGESFLGGRRNFKVSTNGVKKVVLDNGMTLLMYKITTQPKVLVQMAYDIGSYIEQEGERGLAHLLEHMIFKGTQKLSESDIDTIARKYGATMNAYTSYDVTSYYFEVDKNNWQPFVSILADCMQNARFDEQHLSSELKAVLQELKMYKDSYWNMMFQKLMSIMFPSNHPYNRPIIGYKEDLMNISAERVKNFYKKYYQPNRATLFVVGDFDHDEMTQYVRKEFAGITNSHEPISGNFPELSPALCSTSHRMYEDVKTEQLEFFWRVPGRKDPENLVGEAAAFLLGHGDGSRLYRTLVDEKKIATSVGVYSYTFMEAGSFMIMVEPLEGKIEECRACVIEELKKAVEKGFTAHELEHMVRGEAKAFFQSLQRYGSIVYEWIDSYFATRDEFDFFTRAERITKITSQQVQDFIAKHLDPMVMNQIDVVPIPQNLAKVSEEAKHISDALDKKILEKHVRTAPVEAPEFANHMPTPHHLDFIFPKPDRMVTLPNGLVVLLRENKALPIISVDLKFKEASYLTSSRENMPMALMMSTLMDGSEGFTKKDNVDFFEFYGAECHFGAGGANASLLNDSLDKIFERFFHMLTKPTFPSNEIEKNKIIQADSFKRMLDEPSMVANDILKSKVYAHHPFGWTCQEAIELTKKVDQKKMQELHKQLVTPNNMVLAIAGDFDVDDMQKLVERTFSSWQKGADYAVTYPPLSFTPKEQIDSPMVRDQIVFMLARPSEINIYHDDIAPIRILNYIAFYSMGSRIYQLREQSGLFYSAYGAFASAATSEKGYDFVSTIVTPENVEKAEMQIKALIREIAEKGVTQDELDAAKKLYLKTLIDIVSSNTAVVSMHNMLFSFKLGFDYYDKILARVQSMTCDELNKIAKHYFVTDDMIRIRVGRMPQK